MPQQTKGIVLDSSVVLSVAFENRRYSSRIKKFQDDLKRLAFPEALVTPTVLSECHDRVEGVYRFLTETLRELNQFLMGKNRTEEKEGPKLTEGGFIQINAFFSVRPKTNGLSAYDVSTEKELLEYLETFVVKVLDEAISAKTEILVLDFMVKVAAEITAMTVNIRSRFNPLISECITVDASQDQVVELQRQMPYLRKKGDVAILSEVMLYQEKMRQRYLLVSLDFTDFVKNSLDIARITSVACCDPLYACYYATKA